MKRRSSVEPVAGIIGLFHRIRTWMFLLLPPFILSLLISIPFPELENFQKSPYGIEITDRHEETLFHLPGKDDSSMHRLSRDEIPEPVKELFIRVEDRRFFYHPGIDPLAVVRALISNIASLRIVSGASTISMQLARIVLPHAGGLQGKIKEAITALRLESILSKQEILTLYLNYLPFGYNTHGVGAASSLYFNRALQSLNKAQLLVLASIPKSPALYDPFLYPERLKAKTKKLAHLVEVAEEDIDSVITSLERGNRIIKAPHFIRYIIENKLPGLKGKEISRIVTTLDYSLYQSVLRRIRALIYKSETPVSNASALVIDNRNAQILVWIGSKDFFDTGHSGEIDGVRIRNSSGSTLKPFLYAIALEGDYSPASLLPDLPLKFGAGLSYRPENFDRRNRGPVRLRTALGSSLNVPAVYILSRLGLAAFIRQINKLGFNLPEDAKERYGLGAAVGNIDVSLYELTRAFSVFPGCGMLAEPCCIKEIKTVCGEVISVNDSPAKMRIYNEETAWQICDILSDPSARASGFGTDSIFNTSFKAMFKSGTGSEYSDLWCLGATADYTMGVWAGNFDGMPAPGTTGSSIPAAVVVHTLENLVRMNGTKDFKKPEGLLPVEICTLSGKSASASCPSTRIEYFKAGKTPQDTCPVHAQGKKIKNIEDLLCDTFLEEGSAPRILFPVNRSVFYLDDSLNRNEQSIRTWIIGRPDETVFIRLNGRQFRLSYPFTFDIPVQPGTYTLNVSGSSGSDEITFYIR